MRQIITGILILVVVAFGLYGIGLFFNEIQKPQAIVKKKLTPHHFPSNVCRKFYERFYEQKEVNISVIFGYKDARPFRFVADRYERLLFIESLFEKCTLGNFACGFQRSPIDADRFFREISGPEGSVRMILLQVLQPSVGPDDEENRIDPYQDWKSDHTLSAFEKALTESDAVFYNGHSRAGGGPDFAPPHLRPSKDVDFTWYKARTPGFEVILQALKKPVSRLKMLGLFSCASDGHFSAGVKVEKKDLALIMSKRLVYFSDALQASERALSSLLEMKCEERFQESLKGSRLNGNGIQINF